MAITRTVLVALTDSNSNPIADAIVTALLDQTDFDTVDQEYIIPAQITERTDVNGEATLALWPNARGNVGSRYRVVAQKSDGTVVLDVWATVTDVDGVALDAISDVVNCAEESGDLTQILSNSISAIVVLSAAEYDALPTKSASTLYVVVA